MIFTVDGKDWEFRGNYKPPMLGEYYLTADIPPVIQKASCNSRFNGPIRAIVHPAVKEYRFGGVVWQEVEGRQVKYGDWVKRNDGYVYNYDATMKSIEKDMILRPVRLEVEGG